VERKETEANQGKAGEDEMKERDEAEVIGVDLALIAQERWKVGRHGSWWKETRVAGFLSKPKAESALDAKRGPPRSLRG
jgi:hypothetical protein